MTMNTWETPRRLWLVLAITVSIASVVGGGLGYWIGSTPPAPIVIQLQTSAPQR